jgi:hypothetical protein
VIFVASPAAPRSADVPLSDVYAPRVVRLRAGFRSIGVALDEAARQSRSVCSVMIASSRLLWWS